MASDSKSPTRLGEALASEAVVARYWSYVFTVPASDCIWWTGAISQRGHGRFWLGEGHVIIAHRFAFALANGIDRLAAAEVLDHECDNPLCQNSGHMTPTTIGGNRQRWAARRHQSGGPLRDVRGSRGRSLAIRQAIKDGQDFTRVLAAGVSELDAGQGTLWEDGDLD